MLHICVAAFSAWCRLWVHEGLPCIKTPVWTLQHVIGDICIATNLF